MDTSEIDELRKVLHEVQTRCNLLSKERDDLIRELSHAQDKLKIYSRVIGIIEKQVEESDY